MSDILLAAVVISLFVTAALVGEQYGGIMADRTIAGYAAVGNPGVRVRQSVQLHFLPGTYVNSAIASANRTGRLNLAWEDSNSVTVVVSGSWNPKARVASTATFYNDRLAGVGLTRKYVVDSQTGSHTPATSSTTWPALEIVFGIAMLLLVLVFAIGEYLSVRDLSIPVASITDEDIAKLNLPQPYAQRAQCALALGKDLRILRRSGGAFEVLVIRNSAFAHGSRLTWIPGYETPMQALSAFFKSLIKRINRRTDP